MKQQSITSLPPSPEAERRSRMIKYSIAMSVRLLCIFAMLFVQGWWLAVCAVGAIVLPYIAVVIANVGGSGLGGAVERPGGIVPVSGPGSASAGSAQQPSDPDGGSSGPDRGSPEPDGGSPDPGPGSGGSERMPRGDDDRHAA
ncbi:DUF3099 domain-containing protein [Agromyces sp. NPDC058110]|uniref:DUF3099 domain-containing protein n=1 Tax=Agromyces sp. NPDC058110 TaxID=3346345 RepID=UPI0036DE4021